MFKNDLEVSENEQLPPKLKWKIKKRTISFMNTYQQCRETRRVTELKQCPCFLSNLLLPSLLLA